MLTCRGSERNRIRERSVALACDRQHRTGVQTRLVGGEGRAELDDERDARLRLVAGEFLARPLRCDAGVRAPGDGLHREPGELGVASADGAVAALSGTD